MSTKNSNAYIGEVILKNDEDLVVGFQYLSNGQVVKWTRMITFKKDKDIFYCAKELEEILRIECKKHDFEKVFFKFGLGNNITESQALILALTVSNICRDTLRSRVDKALFDIKKSYAKTTKGRWISLDTVINSNITHIHCAIEFVNPKCEGIWNITSLLHMLFDVAENWTLNSDYDHNLVMAAIDAMIRRLQPEYPDRSLFKEVTAYEEDC